MKKRILYSECVRVYKVNASFIDSLHDLGLITIAGRESERFVEYEDINELEQFIRWHNEMDINPEGVEALYYLLQRVKRLQSENNRLLNELRFFQSFL